MTFPCYYCKQIFESISSMCFHIEIHHLRKNSFNQFYKCGVDSCFQSFQSVYSFKKHMLKQHVKKNVHPSILPTNELKSLENIKQDSDPNNSPGNLPPVNQVHCSEASSSSVESFVLPSQDIQQLIIMQNNEFSPFYGDEVLEFIVNLQGRPNLSRKQVQQIVDSAEKLMTSLFDNIRSTFINKFPITITNEVEHIINRPLNTFKMTNTEHKLIKFLQQKDLFLYPKSFIINNESELVFQSGVPTLDNYNSKGVIMPIEFQIKKFFELPNVLNEVIENTAKLSMENDLCNFVNGKRWKNIAKKYEGQIVIPFFLYNDDFQVDNALGSHSGENSISAFYYSFPTLPAYCGSSLENIFLCMLVKSKYIKAYGNDSCLHLLVDTFKKIEVEGIKIKSHSGEIVVRFILGLLIGDNLGLNSILGFTKSFNANFYCRFCKMPKSLSYTAVKEDLNFLRDKDSYAQDLIKQDISLTGIYENCLLNNLENFHVTNNFSVDIMHDIFLGVCKYGICQVILFYITYTGYFTLDFLNYRKQNFDYGSIEIGNMSLPIKLEHIKKNIIHMSARETWCFITFFPLIIGDLIPENDEVWKYVITLSKLVDILLLPRISEDLIVHLNSLISEHNELFVTVFKENLKPKHHFMIHYARVLRESGPLKYLWSFRFESKHQELKAYAKNITSRVNIAYSIALKFSLIFSGKLLKKSDIFKPISNPKFSKLTLPEISYFEIIKDNLLSYTLIPENNFQLLSVEYKGTTYSKNYFILKESIDENIFEIEHMFIANNNIIFICSMNSLLEYNEHFNCYRVGSKIPNNFHIIPIDKFKYPPINLHKLKNGHVFAKIRSF